MFVEIPCTDPFDVSTHQTGTLSPTNIEFVRMLLAELYDTVTLPEVLGASTNSVMPGCGWTTATKPDAFWNKAIARAAEHEEKPLPPPYEVLKM